MKVELELVFWGIPCRTVEDGMCVLKALSPTWKLWNNPGLHVSQKFQIIDRCTTFILAS